MRHVKLASVVLCLGMCVSGSVYAEEELVLQDPIGLEAWSLWKDIKQRTTEHYAAKNFDDAEKMAQKGLEIAHVLVASSLIDLAQVYGVQGKVKETDEAAEQVYSLAEQLYGAHHMVVNIIAEQLAFYYEHLGRMEKSEMWRQRAQKHDPIS